MLQLPRSLAIYLLVASAGSVHDVRSEDSENPFHQANWTLSQIVKLGVTEDGRLVLYRDHWELAAKRPLGKSVRQGAAERKRRSAAIKRMAKWERPPLARLFARISYETGGRGTSSTWQSNNLQRYGWNTHTMAGSLQVEGDTAMDLKLRELTGQQRTFRFQIKEEFLQLIMYAPGGDLVRIVQQPQSLHAWTINKGEVTSFATASFADLVRKHRSFVTELLEPLLADVVPLPIEMAAELNLPSAAPQADWPAGTFEWEFLRQDEVTNAIAAITQLHVRAGKLRWNRFVGRPEVLEEEIAILTTEYQAALDASLKRLRERDVPHWQISQLLARMATWKHVDGHGREDPGHRNQPETPMQQAFTELKSVVEFGGEGGGSSSSSIGGTSFRIGFSFGRVRSELSRNDSRWSFSIADEAVEMRLVESHDDLQMIIESDTGLLMLHDQVGTSCSVILIGGADVLLLRESSFAALIHNNEETWQQKINPIFSQFGCTSLDLFGEHIVGSVVEYLQKEHIVPESQIVSMTESMIVPLLNDAEYLRLLASRLAGPRCAVIESRIEKLAAQPR